MSGSHKSCTLCDYDYDEKSKKPLMLSCGHSFCMQCFEHLSSAMNYLCPVCRTDWSDCRVDSLPVCYQLLPERGANDPYFCLKHKIHTTIWCSSCKLRVCLECCWQDHLKCSWKPVRKAVSDMLDDIGPNTERVRQKMCFWESHSEKIGKLSRQLISTITETLPDIHLLEEVSKMMEFYSNNVDHIYEQIKRSQSNLQSLGLEYEEGDALDLLTVLDEKLTALELLGKEPEWPQIPQNSFLRIMGSFKVIREAFDRLSYTLNDLPMAGDSQEIGNTEQETTSQAVMTESGITIEAVPSVLSDVKGEAGASAGTDPGGQRQSPEEIIPRPDAKLSDEFIPPELEGDEILDSIESEQEAGISTKNDSSNVGEKVFATNNAVATDSSFQYNSSATEVSGLSNVPVAARAFLAVGDDLSGCSSSLTSPQTSSTLISSLASYLRTSTLTDPHDPDLYFFKGILPDVKKLSDADKVLFKQRILRRLNALMLGDSSD